MKLRILHILGLGFLYGAPAVAQPVFNASDLPSTVGKYVRAYYSTNNPNVASLLTLTNESGLPLPPGATNAVWNFSQAEQAYETVLRTDIVSVNDGGYDQGDFPSATYAERDTLEPSTQIGWRYYSVTNSGRIYFGLYDSAQSYVGAPAVFHPPTGDVPGTVEYGQSGWNRSTMWIDLYYIGGIGYYSISNNFHCRAQVDAFGTLYLPQIGGVSALRVHEVHAYDAEELLTGYPPTPVDLHTNQYYYWLVPGLGVAAQIFEFGDNLLYPGSLPYTNAIERDFYASYYPPPVTLRTNWLQIHIQAGSARLNWNQVSNNSSYRVDYSSLLAPTNWQTLGLTTNTSWSDALTATQRFYRVVPQP